MNVLITNTTELVTIETCGKIDARVWEGFTDSGVPVQLLVVRIATPAGGDLGQFERELAEATPPEPGPRAFPLRFVL